MVSVLGKKNAFGRVMAGVVAATVATAGFVFGAGAAQAHEGESHCVVDVNTWAECITDPGLQKQIFRLLKDKPQLTDKISQRVIDASSQIAIVTPGIGVKTAEFVPVKSLAGLSVFKKARILSITNPDRKNKPTLEHLDEIKAFTNVGQLDLSNLKGVDWSLVDGKTKLYNLTLVGDELTEIPDLSKMPDLGGISLDHNKITKISGLSGLKLYYLHLTDNAISKIEGLDEQKKLTNLDLRGNNISKVENLSGLSDLTYFSIGRALADSTGYNKVLVVLNSPNPISKVEGLEGLTKLKSATFDYLPLTDLSALDATQQKQYENGEVVALKGSQLKGFAPEAVIYLKKDAGQPAPSAPAYKPVILPTHKDAPVQPVASPTAPKQTPVTPSAAPNTAQPAQTPVSPVASPVSVPAQTPVSPVASPVSAPAQTPVSPASSPVSSPAQTPVAPAPSQNVPVNTTPVAPATPNATAAQPSAPSAPSTPSAQTEPKTQPTPATPANPTGPVKPDVTSAPVGQPSPVTYNNCDEVRKAGKAPLHPNDPGYSTKLDHDKDGVACEDKKGNGVTGGNGANASNPAVKLDVKNQVAKPQLKLNKSEYAAGEKVEFELTGLVPGDAVVLELHSKVAKVADVVADANGFARGVFELPAGFTGAHELVAKDANGDIDLVKLVIKSAVNADNNGNNGNGNNNDGNNAGSANAGNGGANADNGSRSGNGNGGVSVKQNGAELAHTGADLTALGAAGVALLALAGAATLVARRRA